MSVIRRQARVMASQPHMAVGSSTAYNQSNQIHVNLIKTMILASTNYEAETRLSIISTHDTY